MPPLHSLKHHLSRQTAGRKLIPEIDGLRALAVLAVLLFHVQADFFSNTQNNTGPIGSAIQAVLLTGDYGVPFFFTISGFILALPFAQHHLTKQTDRPTLAPYLHRRLTRLEPPYLVALVIMLPKALLELGPAEALPHALASAFYLHNAIYQEPSLVQVVFWSLEIEVQFYLLMPLLGFVFAIPHALLRRSILATATLALAARFGVEDPVQGLTLLSHAPSFLVGLLLADLHVTSPPPAPDTRGSLPSKLAADAIALTCLASVFTLHHLHAATPLAAPWLTLIAYRAVFEGRLTRRLFRFTPVVLLGGMCYSIYLVHYPAINVVRVLWFKALDMPGDLASLLAFIPIATLTGLAAGALFFVLVERPTMDPKWPNRLRNALRRTK